MRHFIIIAILFSFQNCGQTSGEKNYKIMDNYASVRSSMIAINISDQDLPKRQLEIFRLLKQFLYTYPLSVNCLVLLSSAKNLTASQYNTLYNNLNPVLKEDPYFTSVDLTKVQIEAAETGRPFPHITLTDSLHKTINTASYKGKILFLDFWSSWCVSCRAQFPHLKKIFENNQAAGVNIIGITMDSDKLAWQKALQQDSLPWPQYGELVPFQENALAKKFHIMGIPANFLIDKDGLLIGQDLSTQELEILISRH